VPAGTRLARQIAISFAIIFAGILIARVIAPSDDSPKYELSNSPGEIATNGNLIGRELARADLIATNGEKVSTESLRGKPLILNVWYSTCEPCRRELPVLAAAAKSNTELVRFIGVNIKDSAEVATDFAANYGVQYELLLDPLAEFISSSRISTVPMTLAVNADGIVVDQVAGEISAEKLGKLIAELVK